MSETPIPDAAAEFDAWWQQSSVRTWSGVDSQTIARVAYKAGRAAGAATRAQIDEQRQVYIDAGAAAERQHPAERAFLDASMDPVPARRIIRPQCEHEELCKCSEVLVRCEARARFAIRRADTDPSYIPFDSCEEHLAYDVGGMADGDHTTPLLVTIYWDWAS